MKEDLSGWKRCLTGCGYYAWQHHRPDMVSYLTFNVYACKICGYRTDIARYRRQYALDLHNKITVNHKWVRDTEDHSVSRVSRTTAWLFKTLDTDKALEIFEDVFNAHVDRVPQLWVRNLRLDLSRQPQ